MITNLPNCVDIKMTIKNIVASIFYAITNKVVVYIFISTGIFVLAVTVYGVIKYFINKKIEITGRSIFLKKLMYLLFSLFMSYIIFLMLITHLGILYDVF